MYYGLSSPIEFDLESGLAPMSNVIVQLGSVRFEVTFEDAQNFELIQRLPTEDIYVSAQGEKALPNSDIFLLRYFQLESSEPPLNVFFFRWSLCRTIHCRRFQLRFSNKHFPNETNVDCYLSQR